MNPVWQIYGIDLASPRVMAVVNVTPDSFYAASRTADAESIVARVRSAVEEGAAIIDVGGFSSRPGADDVAVVEEIRRVEMGIRAVREVSRDIPVSVDTFRAAVARHALKIDSRIVVNDISAGALDPEMIPTVAEAGVPYVAMHMRGTPATMSSLTDYDDVVAEVAGWLSRRADFMMRCGMRAENIILDPGFGFAKSVPQNYELMNGLHEICALGFPVVAGISRKSMIWRVLGSSPDEALAGTSALNWEALRQGAKLLRVHDVRAAADTVKIFNEFQNNRR